jgi:diguanylate cyclase (GGDEF)-like protein
LTLATRDADIVCRFGGDEFAVLLEVPTDAAVASAVAKRIVDAFRRPFKIGGEQVNLGASVGVAMGEPAMSSAELIDRADSAMYQAKSVTKVAVFNG